MEQLDRVLRSQKIALDQPLLDAYSRYLKDPQSLRVELTPTEGMSWDGLQFFEPKDVVGMLRPALLVMGRRIALPPGPLVIVPPAPGLSVPQGGDQRRIALLALDQGAWALAGALGLDVADSRTEIDWAAANGLAVVWAPCRMAADADVPATPGLLALWLADRLDAPRIDWALPEGAALPPEAAGFRIPSVLLGA